MIPEGERLLNPVIEDQIIQDAALTIVTAMRLLGVQPTPARVGRVLYKLLARLQLTTKHFMVPLN